VRRCSCVQVGEVGFCRKHVESGGRNAEQPASPDRHFVRSPAPPQAVERESGVLEKFSGFVKLHLLIGQLKALKTAYTHERTKAID
jgi:hypothetical protein